MALHTPEYRAFNYQRRPKTPPAYAAARGGSSEPCQTAGRVLQIRCVVEVWHRRKGCHGCARIQHHWDLGRPTPTRPSLCQFPKESLKSTSCKSSSVGERRSCSKNMRGCRNDTKRLRGSVTRPTGRPRINEYCNRCQGGGLSFEQSLHRTKLYSYLDITS